MATVPVDIIFFNILVRLPAKSLAIFKCVSKSWRTHISSPQFISLHLTQSLSSHNHLLIILTSSNDHTLFSLHLTYPQQLPVHKLPLIPTSVDFRPFIVGSSHGLLCVDTSPHGHGTILVVNPCTGICREIEPLCLPRRTRSVNYAFGYDRASDDYKVVRVLDYYSSPRLMFSRYVSRQVNVFSLKGGQWRDVDWCVPYDRLSRSGQNGAVIDNHLVHWKVWSSEQRKYRIICFDLCQEKWVQDVGFPEMDQTSPERIFDDLLYEDIDADKQSEVLELGVFDGCLFVTMKGVQQSCDPIPLNVALDVWVLKEYGVEESWYKLFRISDANVTGSLRMAPIAYGNGRNEILVRRDYKTDQKLFWYDVEKGLIEDAEFDGVGDCFWADLCVGSLVPVHGGRPIEMANQA